MAAKDKIHDAVRTALTNDDWIILKEHFYIEYEELDVSVDIAAKRKPLVAAKDDRKILVEVKTFGGRSFMRQLQQALGQYSIYRDMVEFTELDYELYLAISQRVYQQFFQGKAIEKIVKRHKLKVIVVDLKERKIIKWIL